MSRLVSDVKTAFREAVELRQVLTSALTSETGWRQRARQVLGLEQQISCLRCGTKFPSGGKKKKFCKDLCRQLYVRPKEQP